MKWEKTSESCFFCNGNGEIVQQDLFDCDESVTVKCGVCRGTGSVEMEICPCCKSVVVPRDKVNKALARAKKLWGKKKRV